MKVESVAIIGAGSIGGTIAFGLLALNDPFKEILLVDMSKDIVQAQILDLSDAASCGETIIRGATFKEAGKCDLIILAANTPSIEKEPHDKASSLFTQDTLSHFFFSFSFPQLLVRNQRFIYGVAASMQPIQPNATLIVAVEPVDIFVDQLRRITSLRPERIMGTGHITICHHRFRRWFHEYQAGLKLVSTAMTEPWVIGTAQAPIVIWPELTKKDGKKKSGAHDTSVHQLKENWVGNIMFESTLIVEKKGDAWFGASGSVMQLVGALLNPDDAHALHTVVCTWHPQLEVCASFPVILTNQGIVSTIDIPLEDADKDSLISMALEQTLTV